MKDQLDIFIFIDALGWELVQQHEFLREELPFRREIVMQFGYSCTAVPTILTGCRPFQHGHFSFFYYDPQKSPFKALKIFHHLLRPRSFWNRGRIRNLLSKFLRKWYGYTGYFQLYQVPFDRIGYLNYCEKTDLFAPGGMHPVPNLQDRLIEAGVPYHISNWRASETDNLAAATQAVQDGTTKFLFIYLADLDSLLHDRVGQEDPVRRKLMDYQKHIRNLLAEAKKHAEKVTLTVFSDHGMTPLKGCIDLKKVVEQTGLQFGSDYAACYDSTMLRAWFLKPGAKGIFSDKINSSAFPGHWLRLDEKIHYGIDGGPVNYGDAIFLLDPGYQIVPSDMGLKSLSGMHGYQPDDKDSLAVVLSTNPVPECVREVADLFSLMQDSIKHFAMKPAQPEMQAPAGRKSVR